MKNFRRILLATLLLLWGVTSVLSADDCVTCHTKETPGAVTQWHGSAHADRVGCADCHGQDHDKMVSGDAFVDAEVCGRCHEDAYRQHMASRHGLSLHAGWGCTRNLKGRDPDECRFCHEEGSTQPRTAVHCSRFLAQSSEMGVIGCNRCHQVENSCASCHTNHITDLATVREPDVCATCHMGPDHPQWEMWQTSRHGLLYETVGRAVGPGCQACHMKAGSHDVSSGITMTPGMKSFDPLTVTEQRQAMVAICHDCHSKTFSERELSHADAVHQQSLALVKEAEEVIRDLADHGLLVPSLEDRPEHPLRGQALVLDGQMLYEDYSHIERLFFKMKKFDLAKTVKGAYHQNPAYTHWYGNAELKMTLVDIKAEAARLKTGLQHVSPVESPDRWADIETELRVLKNKHQRGAIDDREYSEKKAELLRDLKMSTDRPE